MPLTETFNRVLARHDELRDALSKSGIERNEFVRLSKEYSDLTPVAEAISALASKRRELAEAEAMLADPEMQAEAKREAEELRAQIPALEKQVQRMLLPKDAADERNAILEIRAGAGGDEAALFAAELFAMYRKYAGVRGWRFEVLEYRKPISAACAKASPEISGKGVFARLKYESGVHRVQRVPETEARAASTPPPPPSPCCRRRRRSMCRSTKRICGSTSIAPPAPAASTSTRPKAPCASRICRPASSWRCRRNARSTRTAPRR